VIPAVRAAAPTTLWEAGDPYGNRPEFTRSNPSANASRSENALVH